MKKILTYLLLSSTILFIFSCQNETILAEEVDLETEYYPLGNDKVWEYQIDSTIYDNAGNSKTMSTTFVRETMQGPIEESETEVSYLLEVAKKTNLTDIYFPTDQWILRFRDNKLIRIEENLSFVKLIFPPNLETVWEGNQFDPDTEIFVAGDPIQAYKDWDYRVLDRLDTLTVGEKSYNNILQVQQANSENQIEKRYSIEHYAFGIGLIEREMWILDTQDFDSAQPWVEKAEQGFILRQRLIDHY